MTQQDDTATGTLMQMPEANSFPAMRQFFQVMELESEAPGDMTEDFMLDLMEQILAAETEEEIFAAQSTGMIAGKDFTNRPFWLRGDDIQIRKTTYRQGGLPWYAVMKVTEVATNDEFVLNCGGKTFMAVLQALRNKGYFDNPDFPHGRSLSLVGHEAQNGTYLTLMPFVIKSAKANGKAK